MRTRRRFGVAVLAVAALAVLLIGSGRAKAGLIFFTDQASFDAATTALQTQTFASANVAPGGINETNSPLNSATNDGVFSTGNILPGLSFTTSDAGAVGDIAVTGVGFNGYTNKAIFGNFFGSVLNLNLSPAVKAASANVVSFPGDSTIDISVFSPTSALLGTTTLPSTPSSGSGLFFGVIATGTDQIGSISFTPGDLTVGLDRVQFGQLAPPPPPPTVPEPSSLALLSLGGLALAGWRRWKKRATA
jgi:PEP-CTERM motif